MKSVNYEKRIRGVSRQIVGAARRLRREMTSAELCLWDAISGKKLGGLRFRSQHAVDRFVLDFYCPASKLVVEVDGSHHQDQLERDEERAKILEAYGCRDLRLTNEQVLTDLPNVLSTILAAAHHQGASNERPQSSE